MRQGVKGNWASYGDEAMKKQMAHDMSSRRQRLGCGNFLAVLCVSLFCFGPPTADAEDVHKTRLLLVDSYHREFLWSQFTHQGFAAGLLQYGYLDNDAQVKELLEHDAVESSKAIVKILWMDTKRKNSKPELNETTSRLTEEVRTFQPDLLFLGDDNAANYLGNQFLDTELPIVLWGINNTLVKYGLVDSLEHPGHNVTGVVEPENYIESMQLLKRLVPTIKTIAGVFDEGETGRSNAKALEFQAREGNLPVELVENVVTLDFETMKKRILELQDKVDAFLVLPTMAKDAEGKPVTDDVILRWYLTNVHKPDVTKSRRGVTQGILCAADIDPHNQGVEGVRIAHDILSKGMKPATYPGLVPKIRRLIVNRRRAQMLGITLTPEMGIEEIIEEAAALKEPAGKP